MPNYQESAVAGTEYRRARFLQISNERNNVPNILIFEERVIQFDNESIGQDIDRLSAQFEAQATFPQINVETGEPTENSYTHQDIYVMLHSLYRDLAAKRDAAQIPVQPEPAPEVIPDPVPAP